MPWFLWAMRWRLYSWRRLHCDVPKLLDKDGQASYTVRHEELLFVEEETPDGTGNTDNEARTPFRETRRGRRQYRQTSVFGGDRRCAQPGTGLLPRLLSRPRPKAGRARLVLLRKVSGDAHTCHQL